MKEMALARANSVIVSSYAISAGFPASRPGFSSIISTANALCSTVRRFGWERYLRAGPGYHLLVMARALAGLRRVTGALILAIMAMSCQNNGGRGHGSGHVCIFAGDDWRVPCGLYLRSTNWHMPFFALAGLSAIILRWPRGFCRRCAAILPKPASRIRRRASGGLDRAESSNGVRFHGRADSPVL